MTHSDEDMTDFMESNISRDEHFALVFEDLSEERWRRHFRLLVKKYGLDGVHYLDRLREPDSKNRNIAAADVAREWREKQVSLKNNVALGVSLCALGLSILTAFIK